MPLDIPRIRALCFDIDGTLSNTDDQYVLRICHWLKPVQSVFPNRDARPFARKIVMLSETPANVLLGMPDWLGFNKQMARVGNFFYRLGLGRHPEPFLLVPGVDKMLEKLQPCFPMSIVSARRDRIAALFLKQFGLEDCFSCVATAYTCKHTKPFPDPILWAAAQMKVPAQACLMIGDTTFDIRAGKACGAQTVGVLCGFGTESELHAAGADLILQNTDEIADILLA